MKPDYPVQGGYVSVPVEGGGGGGARLPEVGTWYENAQGPVDEAQYIPASGQYDFVRIPPLGQGDRRVVLVSQFCVTVGNRTDGAIEVRAQIGVGSPSEVDYPMRPYAGVLHSNANATVLPGSAVQLCVLRMDVINPDLLETDFPWQVEGEPVLVPQVFGPGGTVLFNCAFIAYLAG